MALEVERRAIIRTALAMNACGLNQGRSGNLSLRTEAGVLVTPSGVAYDRMRPRDLVLLAPDGQVVDGDLAPTSEWRFHIDILASRPDIQAILHAHAPFATTISCLPGTRVPPFHYMIAVAGGADLRIAPYATFGTADLSANAVAALDGRRACLLANHGLIATGNDLSQALALAQEVETLMAMYWRTLAAGGPTVLADKEMKTVLDKFVNYGKQGGKSASS